MDTKIELPKRRKSNRLLTKPIFLPYQLERIHDTSRFAILVKSRQIGFTFSYAFKRLYHALFSGRNGLILSASQRQSNRAMSYISGFLEEFNKYFGLSQAIRITADSRTEKAFSNGNYIMSLPAKPETIRGFNGDVFLDEYALYREDERVYEAILPSITGGFAHNTFGIEISSTPLGNNNKFAEIYNDPYNKFPGFFRKKITVYDAIKDGFNVDIDSIRDNIDDRSFRQEYECEFIDEVGSFFPFELLRNCIEDYIESNLKGKTCMGIDIGRTNDRSTIIVTTEQDSRIYLRDMIVLHQTEFDKQQELISDAIYRFQPTLVFIDKGGIGMQIAETLEKLFPQVQGVVFSVKMKNELATNAKRVMELGEFKMYDERDLLNDFHGIQRVYGSGNSVSFDAKRNEKGHADRAWACMLSLLAHKKDEAFKIAHI